MSQKKRPPNNIPPGNQPKGSKFNRTEPAEQDTVQGAPFEDQDPKRRLGNYGTAGEHPIQQPGGKKDSDH